MKIKFFLLATFAAVLLATLAPKLAFAQSSTQTPQPMMAYISSIKGQKTGQIKGDVTQKGKEGWFQLFNYSHEIVSPRDVASGQATGRRQHKPIVVTRRVGAGSPLLMQALVNNETLTEVRFSFWQPQTRAFGSGVEVNYYNVSLANASIASYKQFNLPGVGLMEEIQFTYQKIEMTLTDGGVTANDDWQTRF
jgi:type VI secretion system secreted protein Hcp